MTGIDGNDSAGTGLHLERVRFERVFDVPVPGGGLFSFEGNGMRQYGVVFRGDSAPPVGAEYAVVLSRQGDWQTVQGWRNLATCDVYLSETAWQFALQYAWVVYMGVPLLTFGVLLGFGPWPAALAALLLLGAAYAVLRSVVRRNRAVERMLRAAPPQAPPGTGRTTELTWRQRFVHAINAIPAPW